VALHRTPSPQRWARRNWCWGKLQPLFFEFDISSQTNNVSGRWWIPLAVPEIRFSTSTTRGSTSYGGIGNLATSRIGSLISVGPMLCQINFWPFGQNLHQTGRKFDPTLLWIFLQFSASRIPIQNTYDWSIVPYYQSTSKPISRRPWKCDNAEPCTWNVQCYSQPHYCRSHGY